MATKEQIKAIHLYAGLMEEVKIRLDALDAALIGPPKFTSPIFAKEFCFLQLRMLCELIALGCLVAHGDIKATQTQAVMGMWSAKKILAELEKLHPAFYPEPHTQDPTDRTRMTGVKAGFLTQAQLPQLYLKCGSFLHKGNLRKLLSTKTPAQVNL